MVGTYEELESFSRHTNIPLKQHHVIVHRRRGRVYFRTSARMPVDRLYYVKSITWMHGRIFRLTFAPIPEDGKVRRKLLPSRQGTTGLNFHDVEFASLVIPEGKEHVRLRITKRTRKGHGNVFRIWLSALPVRDLCSIWQNMASGVKEKATLKPKKHSSSCKKQL